MKLSNLFWGLLGVMAFSACSSDEITSETDSPEFDGQSRFLSVQIANPAAIRTRADVNPGNQDGDLFEEGLANENEVKSIRFYFFKADGSACPVRREGKNYYDYSLESKDLGNGESEMPNIEEKVNAVLVIETDKDDNVDGLKSMVAVLNGGVGADCFLGDANKSLSQLRDEITLAGTAKDGFLMTSSVFGSETFRCEVEVTADKLKTKPESATADPVNIYVERVWAKTRLYTEWKEGVSSKTVTFNEKEGYIAIPLKTAKDSETNITVGEGEDAKVVYAIFTGWDVTSTADKAYLFKKVDSEWNLSWNWNMPVLYRSYWAQNPAGTTLAYLSYNEITKKVGTKGVENGNSTSYDGHNAYCLENAADNNDGTKSDYEPADALSNRTQAIIAAVLVTVDENNVATPLSLAEWGGTQYTEDGALTAMLGIVNTQIYTKEVDGENEKLVSISKDMVKLVSGIDAGVADGSSEDSKRYLSYLQLNEETAKDVTFYKANGEAYATHADVNKVLANKNSIGARIWSSGKTYYYTDIKHEDGAENTKGKYGVVRNHIYDIAITSVAGLGTPVLNPDEKIIPQHPKNDDTYLAARINILSWRVVKQNVDLEW
ncbi:Mfa1 family fimbria major subunit [Bacteroides congonensis]|uniref:Mfa1 family fimbria major subunit n=1 Tax=Bacteroides congonensis TaxID=1871006 RepID=UPI00189D6AAB|nr:Mfa1 family fimbria major subunit [Bacteroides congonensis]